MLRAIIFDFDGVIADTEPLHYAAFAGVLEGRGVMPSREAYYETYVGLNDAAFLRTVFAEAGHALCDDELRTLLDRKDAAYMERIAGGLPLLPGVEHFVRRASGRYPLAICSGARRVEIETILRAAGLLDFFPIIVSADDVALSKPDPAGFLRALELLAAGIANQPDSQGSVGVPPANQPEAQARDAIRVARSSGPWKRQDDGAAPTGPLGRGTPSAKARPSPRVADIQETGLNSREGLTVPPDANQPEARAREGVRTVLRPDECLVIEDSANGVAAAQAAGMKVVRVCSHAGASQVEADLVVEDLTGLTVERIMGGI